MFMQKVAALVFLSALVAIGGCARCYNCKQHCAFCVKELNSAVAIKVCATKSTGYSIVDSTLAALKDSGYVCNLLDDYRTVCDNKNGIDEAVAFYQKQEYFCMPR